MYKFFISLRVKYWRLSMSLEAILMFCNRGHRDFREKIKRYNFCRRVHRGHREHRDLKINFNKNNKCFFLFLSHLFSVISVAISIFVLMIHPIPNFLIPEFL